ncbi:MAG: TonB family protein [Alloprevotella sp.]|nr:TonB family protein [Alloprevotella sp.]
MLVYLITVNVVWAVCYLLYRLCRGRDTFFGLRRALLLGIVAFALMFPFLSFIHLPLSSAQVVAVDAVQQQVWQQVWMPVRDAMSDAGTSRSGGIALALIIIYTCVAAVLLLRFAVQVTGVMRVIARSPRQHAKDAGSLRYRLLPDGHSPFSFFGWLCIPRGLLGTAYLPHVLRHEAVHIRQWHSADTCLLRVLCALCWFNPAGWLTLAELRNLHEYIADGEASRTGARSYQYALLGLAPCKAAATVANSFTSPRTHEAKAGSRFKGLVQWFNVLPLKKRILMLNKRRTHGAWRSKYLLLAPAGLILMAFNQPINSSVKEAVLPTIENGLNVAPWSQQTSEAQGAAAAEDFSPIEEVSALGTTMQLAIALADSLKPGEKGPAHQLIDLSHTKDASQQPLLVVDGTVVDMQRLEQLSNEDIASISVLKGESATSVWGSRAANGAICVVTNEFERRVRLQEIVVDTCTTVTLGHLSDHVAPKYPGGQVELTSFIARNVRYPQEALGKGATGRVLVSVGVDTDGSVEVIGATGTEEKSLRDAAIEAVKKIPRMIPGTENGKPVFMTTQIPVTFHLR